MISQTDNPIRRIRVVRESGGVGDVIRLLPVFDGLRAKYPDAEIDFYGLDDYRELIGNHCPSVDRYIVCPRNKRRPRDAPLDETQFRYLAKSIQYDLEIDEYCPAWRHERGTRGSVTRDRVQLFCEAAGVEPGPVRYHLTPEEQRSATDWIRSLPADPARVVAIQPFSTHLARGWSPKRWVEFAERLIALDFYPAFFDCVSGRVRDFPGHHECANPLTVVAAQLWACNHLVGVDSGLMHVAGAVGTPFLGVFGNTSGAILCRPYPRASWISGPVPPDAPRRCKPPCYAFPDRGYENRCRDQGCAVAQAVTADQVLDAFLNVYVPKDEYVQLGDLACVP